MAEDQGQALRRCEAYATDDFTISPQQLVASGDPHRSTRDMLAASSPANRSISTLAGRPS